MTISDATRVRVIRALIGMDSKTFAAELGICAATMANWEKGRTAPTPVKRWALARLCQENGIGMTPSGMPVPFADCFMFKEKE